MITVFELCRLNDQEIGELIRETVCKDVRIEPMDASASGNRIDCTAGDRISALDASDVLPATDVVRAVEEWSRGSPTIARTVRHAASPSRRP